MVHSIDIMKTGQISEFQNHLPKKFTVHISISPSQLKKKQFAMTDPVSVYFSIFTEYVVEFPILDPISNLMESIFHCFTAALPRSESTPGLVESRGKVTLEEMWVSPMPLNSISHDKSSSDCT